MKSGKYLGDQRGVVTYLVKEFKLTPKIGECKSPFLIDGDPHEFSPVHVELLHRALPVYVIPNADVGHNTAVAVAANTAIAPATGLNLAAAMRQHKDQIPANGIAAGLAAMMGAGSS
jgi:hypothetical protein